MTSGWDLWPRPAVTEIPVAAVGHRAHTSTCLEMPGLKRCILGVWKAGRQPGQECRVSSL